MLVANYATKKALKEAIGESLRYTETSMFGREYHPNDKLSVVGPSAYDRKWYASVKMVNGKIAKVS